MEATAQDALLLSRFVVLFRHGGELRLVSARTGAMLRAAPALLSVLQRFQTPTATEQAASDLGVSAGELWEELAPLRRARILVPAGPEGRTDEDEEPFATWEVHDALFHAVSRGGKIDDGVWPPGGTYRFRSRLEPLPARRAATGGERLRLPQPRPAALPPLDVVLRSRRSRRRWAATRVDTQAVSDLLHHAARTQDVQEDTLHRPYPGGGGLHAINLLLLTSDQIEFGAGVWRYDHEQHELEWVSASSAAGAEKLRADVGRFPWCRGTPPLILVLTCRFGRMHYKYQRMSYAAILKEAGGLMQNLYLVATALDLACCALGFGDSESCAGLLGRDFFSETSVGELVMGPAC